MVRIQWSGIDTQNQFTYVSRVPCVGEAVVFPDNTTYAVTQVAHLAHSGETEMAVAVVMLGPPWSR